MDVRLMGRELRDVQMKMLEENKVCGGRVAASSVLGARRNSSDSVHSAKKIRINDAAEAKLVHNDEDMVDSLLNNSRWVGSVFLLQ